MSADTFHKLVTKSGNVLAADLFIDCSGFSALLPWKHFGVPFPPRGMESCIRPGLVDEKHILAGKKRDTEMFSKQHGGEPAAINEQVCRKHIA